MRSYYYDEELKYIYIVNHVKLTISKIWDLQSVTSCMWRRFIETDSYYTVADLNFNWNYKIGNFIKIKKMSKKEYKNKLQEMNIKFNKHLTYKCEWFNIKLMIKEIRSKNYKSYELVKQYFSLFKKVITDYTNYLHIKFLCKYKPGVF